MATIVKRGDTYRIRVSVGYSTDGRQIMQSMTWKPAPGMTKRQEEKELNRQATLFEERVKSGQHICSNIKFADFVDRWFKDYAEKQLRPNTLVHYQSLKERTNTAIGHIRLDRLQPHHLLEFYDNLAEKGIRGDIRYKCAIDFKSLLKNKKMTYKAFAEKAGISEQTITSLVKGNNISEKSAQAICSALDEPIKKVFASVGEERSLSGKTIQHHHRYISSVLSTAVQWQIIASNPCDRVKPPKAKRKEAKYLNEEESLMLLECLKDEPILYKTLYTLILYTGMRREEACGLTWEDVDFDNEIIDINKASIYIAGKGVFDDETKNESSRRVIKVPAPALQQLKEYKKHQAQQRLKLGDKWNGSKKIFTSWDGKALHPCTVSKWFHDFINRHELPEVTVHGLRHTNATLLIYNGTNIKTVSSRLGHADVSTTGNIYAHAIKTADEMAAETLKDIFSKKTKEA